MWEGRSREHWAHTSATLAQAYNLNRGRGDAARRPADFDPWAKIDERRRDDDVDNIDRLTRDFVDRAPQGDEDGPGELVGRYSPEGENGRLGRP